MRIQRIPQEKKRLSLKKDHPLQAKYPHAFRKSWPKKKRRAQQAFRHKVKQELGRVKGPTDEFTGEQIDPESIRREKIYNWSAASLGEVIAKKKLRRITSYQRKKKSKAQWAAIRAQESGTPNIG